jgi:hypothetical protein
MAGDGDGVDRARRGADEEQGVDHVHRGGAHRGRGRSEHDGLGHGRGLGPVQFVEVPVSGADVQVFGVQDKQWNRGARNRHAPFDRRRVREVSQGPDGSIGAEIEPVGLEIGPDETFDRAVSQGTRPENGSVVGVERVDRAERGADVDLFIVEKKTPSDVAQRLRPCEARARGVEIQAPQGIRIEVGVGSEVDPREHRCPLFSHAPQPLLRLTAQRSAASRASKLLRIWITVARGLAAATFC